MHHFHKSKATALSVYVTSRQWTYLFHLDDVLITTSVFLCVSLEDLMKYLSQPNSRMRSCTNAWQQKVEPLLETKTHPTALTSSSSPNFALKAFCLVTEQPGVFEQTFWPFFVRHFYRKKNTKNAADIYRCLLEPCLLFFSAVPGLEAQQSHENLAPERMHIM